MKQGAEVHHQQGLSPEDAEARDYAPADVKILTIAHVPESCNRRGCNICAASTSRIPTVISR